MRLHLLPLLVALVPLLAPAQDGGTAPPAPDGGTAPPAASKPAQKKKAQKKKAQKATQAAKPKTAPAAPPTAPAPPTPAPEAPAQATAPPEPAAPTLDIAELDLSELLDTRIASVSRREERAAAAPASVFVVTREDIRRHAYRTLEDVLRSIPGMFTHDDTLYPTAGVRGIQTPGDLTTRLLVLVDGHPLNNSVGIGQSYITRDLPVNMAAVDRVEVIKGPVGSVYGPLAYFGVVNLVTRPAGEGHTGQVTLGGELAQGAPNAGEVAAFYSGAAAGLSWTLNLGLYRSNGYTYAFPELVGQERDVPAGGIIAGADRRWAQNAYGTLRYREFTLLLGWTQRQKMLPTAPYDTVVGSPLNNFYNQTGFAQLSWQRQLTDRLELYARASYDSFHYTDDLEYPPPPDDAGMFYDVGRDRWGSAEVRATVTPFANHRDLIGVEVQLHGTHQLSKYVNLPTAIEDPDEGFGVGPIDHQFATANAYLMVEHRLLEDRLLLQGGLTFYAHQLFGTRLTPKVAAVFQASPADTLKAIYSEGFRPPTMFEAFFEDGLDFIPNLALLPEGARSFEVAYERRFEGLATLGISAYHARYENLIQANTVELQDSPGEFRQQFRNAGTTAATGVDLYFNVRLRRTVHAYGGIAAQLASFGGDAGDANFAPLTANVALSSNALWDPLTFALDASFVSARTKDPATVVLPGDRLTVDPYLLTNATVRLDAPWVRGLAAQLTVYNLLDWAVVDPIVGDHAPLSQIRHVGRSFRLELEYHF